MPVLKSVKTRAETAVLGDLDKQLIELIPRFNSITVTAITRDADWWCGALRALLRGGSEGA